MPEDTRKRQGKRVVGGWGEETQRGLNRTARLDLRSASDAGDGWGWGPGMRMAGQELGTLSLPLRAPLIK